VLQEIVTEDTTVGSNHFKASEDNPKVRVKSDKSGKEVGAACVTPSVVDAQCHARCRNCAIADFASQMCQMQSDKIR
jgi:hypothetical protein